MAATAELQPAMNYFYVLKYYLHIVIYQNGVYLDVIKMTRSNQGEFKYVTREFK